MLNKFKNFKRKTNLNYRITDKKVLIKCIIISKAKIEEENTHNTINVCKKNFAREEDGHNKLFGGPYVAVT